jgi:chitinase
VDAAAAGTANGTVVQQWACNGTNAQSWQFQATSGGYYRVVSRNNAAQAWDVAGVSTADGGKIQLWAYGGGNNQQWLPVAESGGYYHLTARHTGKCLDVPAASTADGVQLQQWTCNGTGAQSFRLQASGATPTPTIGPGPTPTPGNGNFPARFSAPYVATWNNPNLASLASSTGNKFWTLAFIINGGGSCNPMWNGDTPLTTTYNVSGLRAAGGDVIASFGGASGVEIAASCGDVASTQAAYQKVINAMGLKALDLDIESGYESDTVSIDRRNKALHNLQAANPGLRVDYTLAVDRSGLPAAQINLLKNAKSNGVAVASVNVMAMDYGPCYSDMGQAAVDAANATRNQLSANGISAGVGVTPMIGVNDTTCENFKTSDASVLVNYANANSFINLLAYWEQSADPGNSYISIFRNFH